MSEVWRPFLIILLSLSSAFAMAQDSVDPYADVPQSRAADGAFVLGDPAAAVKLIEFSDFLCGSCQNYEPIISSFIWDYVMTGQAQFEYRIFPVIDPVLSVQSASLVECADTLRPGAFWLAHDLMFDMAAKVGFTAESVGPFADALELDVTALAECAAGAGQHTIDAAYGRELGVMGTPTLFVQYGNNVPTPIAVPLAEHLPAIVNAIRPESTDPIQIEVGNYAGLQTYRRADGGFVLGQPDAPLTIVAFEDFLCPHCQLYAPTVKQFIDEQVRAGAASFEFRLYPLVNPQFSTTFAKVAECVAVQDLRLFWDAHDLLFEFAGSGNMTDLPTKLAKLLALDADGLITCLDRSTQFLVDTRLGQSLGVSGTPAIRARDSRGNLDIVFTGQQPHDRGGLPLDLLTALAEGEPGITIGAPEPSLLNDGFLRESSLISGEPCAPPCWQNITPGETDMGAAVEIVSALENLNIVQAVDSGLILQEADGEPCCQVASDDDGLVAYIYLRLAPQTGVGEVLAEYGVPEFITGQALSESEALLLLYYPAHQMFLYAVVPGIDGQLEESSPVVTAVYATTASLERAFAGRPFDLWKGYLKYSEYMDGEFDYQP